MTYTLVFAQEFYTDLQESIDWYNNAQAGLGTRFFNSAKRQLSLIKKTPKSFAIRYKDVRCSKIETFPYLIHYKIVTEANTIKIVAIFNTNLNPSIWEERNHKHKS